MKLLRKLFGGKTKAEPQKKVPAINTPVVAEPKPARPLVSLEVVAQTSDEQALLQLASEGTTSQLRQAAAEKIQRRELLEQLAKSAKHKDKNVFKLVKSKLDVFKAEDTRQAEREKAAAQLCEKLEKHSFQEADSLFKARLALLQQEWQALDNTSPAVQQRYQAALALCESKIQAQAAAIAEEEERAALDAQARELAASALAGLQPLQQELISKQQLSEEDASQFELRLQELAQALRLAGNRALPLQDINHRFEQGRQQLTQLLDQIKTSGTLTQLADHISAASNSDSAKKWRQQFQQQLHNAKQLLGELPDTAQQAKQKVDAWFSEINAQEQAVNDSLRQVSELIRKGLWAAEQGFVRKARGIHKELQEKLASLGNLPKGLQNKLEELDAQLLKLGDWHEFAVTPKKEALVEQMQALVNSSLAPDALASKIHDLQDSWKEVSKGGQQADDNLWQQFQQASALAYAPCKEFFEAQAAARDSNLQKRRELIAQLQNYLNDYHWDTAIWKDVEQTLKVARQEWQAYWPVPRKAGNDLQKTFEGLMEQLFGKISAENERNKQAKLAIIEEAKQLLHSDDLRAATDGAKTLQARWKTIGKSWHREDQQLWQAFREHCDALFARRNEAFEAAKQERQGQVAQARDLLAQLQAFAELTPQALEADKAAINTRIDALKNEFTQLQLPRDAAKQLNEQLHAALNAISERRQSARAHAEQQRWQHVFSAADAVRHYEQLQLSAADDTQLNNAKQTAEALLASEQRWPNGTQQVLQQRFAKAASLTTADASSAADNLRLLCIRAEIANGQASPDSDKALRMNYQVQQLQQSFGQRDNQNDSLVLEWLAVAAVADSDYAPLWARFNQQQALIA